jgi:hypothetical protein
MPKRTALREREARIREMRARLGPSKSRLRAPLQGATWNVGCEPGSMAGEDYCAGRPPRRGPFSAASPGGPPGIHAP